MRNHDRLERSFSMTSLKSITLTLNAGVREVVEDDTSEGGRRLDQGIVS